MDIEQVGFSPAKKQLTSVVDDFDGKSLSSRMIPFRQG